MFFQQEEGAFDYVPILPRLYKIHIFGRRPNLPWQILVNISKGGEIDRMRMLDMDRGGRGLSNGRLGSGIGDIRGDSTIGPAMLDIDRGERGLSNGINITKIGQCNKILPVLYNLYNNQLLVREMRTEDAADGK